MAQLPKHHYSPHTSGSQFYTSPLTSTPTASHHSSSHINNEHRERAGASAPIITDKSTHHTDIRSNLAKLSVKSKKLGVVKLGSDHHTNSSYVSPGAVRELSDDNTSLSYHSQDKSQAHRSSLHVSENQATGYDDNFTKKPNPSGTQSVKDRSVHKVHFESPTPVNSVTSFSSTSDTARLSLSPHSQYLTHSISALSPSSEPHESSYTLKKYIVIMSFICVVIIIQSRSFLLKYGE